MSQKICVLSFCLSLLIGCAAPATELPPIDESSEIVEQTPLSTNTPAPTETLAPTQEPTITPLPTQPQATIAPIDTASIDYTVQVEGIGPHLRDVYLLGQELGRDPHSFSKVGDCHSEQVEFFHAFDTGDYNLGDDYAYLETAIIHFQGSFNRESQAAFSGFHLDTVLDPFWTNPQVCEDGENLFMCELRLHNPSIVLIYNQPHLLGPLVWPDLYRDNLEEAVTYSLDQGIIPVLGTQFTWEGHDEIVADANAIVREVGAEHNVPVWDLYSSTADLGRSPDRGNWHMAYSPYSSADFTDERNMEYAMTIRNLEGLQILHMIMAEVMSETE